MQTYQSLASKAYKYLVTGDRTQTQEEYLYTADEAPEWVKELVKNAHTIDDCLPNDYIYRFVSDALALIADAPDELNSEDSVRDYLCDNVVNDVDVYNNELLKWIGNNLGFSEYVEETMNEYRDVKNLGFFVLLQRAQQLHREAIAQNVLNSLAKQKESEE